MNKKRYSIKPKVLILRLAGTNCDFETEFAFKKNKALTEKIHINRLIENPSIIKKFQILAIPGGFSYGDYISAGKVAAALILHSTGDLFRKFIESDKLIIGICNGFQILIKTGLLPERKKEQTATLMNNDCGSFICKWVKLKVNSKTLFTKNLPEEIYLPIAHAEGKFFASSSVINRLESNNQIAFKYTENPNGSINDIAGITDPSGKILGMMPHPERFCLVHQNPNHMGIPYGDIIFKNMIEWFK